MRASRRWHLQRPALLQLPAPPTGSREIKTRLVACVCVCACVCASRTLGPLGLKPGTLRLGRYGNAVVGRRLTGKRHPTQQDLRLRLPHCSSNAGPATPSSLPAASAPALLDPDPGAGAAGSLPTASAAALPAQDPGAGAAPSTPPAHASRPAWTAPTKWVGTLVAPPPRREDLAPCGSSWKYVADCLSAAISASCVAV